MGGFDPVMKSKNWSAWEDHQPPGPVSFHVTGQVVVRATNYTARLTKARSGINPKILMLNLVVKKTGAAGGDAITTLPVAYSKERFKAGSYSQVMILREGKGGAHIRKIKIVR
jgi:hypothetical protein